MQQFRVTKYDPEKRDESGTYLDDNEWTCPSEVSKEEYLEIEARYILAVKQFFDSSGLSHLRVVNLHVEYLDYLKDFKIDAPNLYDDSFVSLSLKEDQKVSWDVIEDILKVSFRYCHLCSLEVVGKFFIHLGWDFYMYVGTAFAKDDLIDRIQADGMFVERYDSPYQMRDFEKSQAILEVFSNKTHDILDDKCLPLCGVDVSELRKILCFSDEHPVRGCFEISEDVAEHISKIIDVDFNFEEYSYYIDTIEEFL